MEAARIHLHFVSVCLSVCLSVSLSVCLSFCLFAGRSVGRSVGLSVYLSVCLSLLVKVATLFTLIRILQFANDRQQSVKMALLLDVKRFPQVFFTHVFQIF